ncbi:MAG: hypothetical protein JXB32_11630 [Deltaproteobacteria bacterium]|nr:hypothetical protein [Deltaproteobacteria bacterium]
MAVSGRMALLAVAAAVLTSGCGTRVQPHSGAGLDAPPAEGGVEAAAEAIPQPEHRTGPEAEPTDAPPVRWPLAWETIRGLPSCGTHAAIRVQKRWYPVPLAFELSATMQRPDAHYAAFIGIEPTWDALEWTRQDLAADGPQVIGAIDCLVECDGIPWDLLALDSVFYLALGFDPSGELLCAWTNDGAAFDVRFHDLADPIDAVVARGYPGPCDPTNARGALLGPDDRVEVRGIVRCSECESPYVRVRIARASDDYGLDRVDAVVDREFTTRAEAGTAVSLEAMEVLGTRTGRLDGIEVREGRDAIEIRIGGAWDDSEPLPTSLSEWDLREVLRRNRPGIRRCYSDTARGRPDLRIRFDARFEVQPTGAATVELSGDDLDAEPELAACLQRVLGSMVFPAAEGASSLHYTFQFQGAEEEPQRTGGVPLPEGAEFRRDRGGASSMNPGMNVMDEAYVVPGTIEEVEAFYREQLGVEPSRSEGTVTFPLGDRGRLEGDLSGAERTLVTRQEGEQVFVHLRCRGCY